MTAFRDKILAKLATGGAYSLFELAMLCGGAAAEFEVSIALDELVESGAIEKEAGAYRLPRPKVEKQGSLFE